MKKSNASSARGRLTPRSSYAASNEGEGRRRPAAPKHRGSYDNNSERGSYGNDRRDFRREDSSSRRDSRPYSPRYREDDREDNGSDSRSYAPRRRSSYDNNSERGSYGNDRRDSRREDSSFRRDSRPYSPRYREDDREDNGSDSRSYAPRRRSSYDNNSERGSYGNDRRDFRREDSSFRRDTRPRRPYDSRRDARPRFDEKPPRQDADAITPVDVARAFNVAATVWHLFADVIEKGQPLDKLLTAFFRENKKYGSTDRRYISETIYSLCRWWGWCKDLAPDSDSPAIWRCVSRSILENDGRWFHPLMRAWMLDELNDFMKSPICKIWTRHLATALAGEGEKQSSEELLAQLKQKKDPALWKQLFPAWLPSILPADVDVTSLMEAYQTRPPLWLRFQHDVNETLAALAKDDIAPKASDVSPMAFCLENTRVNLFNSFAFRKGWMEVQDISSQCIGLVCAPAPKSRWLDYCAGAGGKTLQLAAMLENKGTVVAMDKRNWKLDDLKKRARRAQLCNIQTRETESEFPKVNKQSFDGVLVDAPCSCTGTWRRNPDARWTTQLSEIEELAQLQFQILEHAAKAVKIGGTLVYATCSVSVAENEDVVARFVTAHPEFVPDAFPHPMRQTPCESAMCRILPSDANGDAMFVARFKRVEQE